MSSTKEYLSPKTKSSPVIYAYKDKLMPDVLKVGYTTRTAEERIAEQYPVKRPGEKPYSIELVESALYNDGSNFTDKNVHKMLKKMGFPCLSDCKDANTEWFKCTVQDVKAALLAVRNKTDNADHRFLDFKMRPEQESAVNKTFDYFERKKKEGHVKAPKFLWNAKMRFGKTFTSYELAKKMHFTRILVLTFKPAVQSAWKEDLFTHIDFEGYQFISRMENANDDDINAQYTKADKAKPIVCFGSFQDFLGKSENGGIKSKNEWVHTTTWDLVIFDEYHYGAWRDNAKHLFESEDDENIESCPNDNSGNNIDESWLPISTKFYLYLSGTPFRALNSGEFIEEQIFSWTYSDEQNAKALWEEQHKAASNKHEANPYASLPKMIMFTYKIPDSIQEIAKQGEYDEFDLNEFFKADGIAENAVFTHKEYVQKWLNLIRGSFVESTAAELKLGGEKPPMPYSDTLLLGLLNHTLWFLPNVASCYAMKNLLSEKQNQFYREYKIIVCAGSKAGIGLTALPPVLNGINGSNCNPLKSKSITLSCGKLTTGVTVKPWTGIFMLRNLNSPETYFQSAFRVQSPWTIKTEDGKTEIVKKECFVFDFALNRALKQISDYSRNLSVNTNDQDNKTSSNDNPETKVAKFIQFLPVLAYDGSSMRQVNAAEILDIAMAGTSATLLAKRWESALLVNVDNETLKKLSANKDAMDALMKIEGFRSLNKEIQTIINKSESIKKAKTKDADASLQEKKEISEAEKEMKSLRKQIQEKLIKFATRIPIFMYLSDYREYSLKDVITQLEPNLFQKVTGLTVKDFDLLVSLNIFNASMMNDAVYKFKCYEDASLSYTGIDKHDGEKIGLYDTVLSVADYASLAEAQGLSV